MLIESANDIDKQIAIVKNATESTVRWLLQQQEDPLTLLSRLKFEKVGRHPIEDHALNFVEQINQTWTYLAALEATRLLLTLHPEAGGFVLAPGAHASQSLDIMSVTEGLVGAETFAAVRTDSNQKLKGDLKKLSGCKEIHRYVFFISPAFPELKRQVQMERDGIQVWSVCANLSC
jgi:hypothetical protein